MTCLSHREAAVVVLSDDYAACATWLGTEGALAKGLAPPKLRQLDAMIGLSFYRI